MRRPRRHPAGGCVPGQILTRLGGRDIVLWGNTDVASCRATEQRDEFGLEPAAPRETITAGMRVGPFSKTLDRASARTDTQIPQQLHPQRMTGHGRAGADT